MNLDSKKPLLVMLHQSPLSSRNYQAALPYLADHFRVVALIRLALVNQLHLIRFGVCKIMQRLLYESADALGVEQFYLFGRATGGVFAFVAALLSPERVEKLVLHGMPVYTEEERTDRLANFAPPYEIDDNAGHLRWIWDRIHSEYPWIDGHLATQFCRDFLNAGPDFATSYRSIWKYDLPKGFAAAGSRLPCPTLILGGGADRIAYMQSVLGPFFGCG